MSSEPGPERRIVKAHPATRSQTGRFAYDAADLHLLEALREDGRIGVSELARVANIPRSTAYVRLARLQDEGVITGFSARVDSGRLGLGITALVMLTLRQPEWRALRAELSAFAELEWFAFITGTFDALALVRVPDMTTLREVVLVRLPSLAQVRQTQTAFVLEEVVRRPYVLPAE